LLQNKPKAGKWGWGSEIKNERALQKSLIAKDKIRVCGSAIDNPVAHGWRVLRV